jgi:short-subunit dehydrogenase
VLSYNHKINEISEGFTMGVALITGASSGIGREFAKQLKENYGITEFWFVARRKDRMEALAETLGVNAHIISADLCEDEAWRPCARR